MNKVKLHDGFVKELLKKSPQRAELVNVLSDILCIEKKSASRRLSGEVQFSVHEMGILAKHFGISLDPLIFKDNHCHWLPFILEAPLGVESMEALYKITEASFDDLAQVAEAPFEYGTLFNSYPIEFYMFHPYLMKFMFFKWGHCFVGTDEFNHFSQWELPEKIANLKDWVPNMLSNSIHTTYIWDESLVWTLVNEIDYFYKMDVLSAEDVENIKSDLKESLLRLEKYIGGILQLEKAPKKVDFYISKMSLGVCSSYTVSEKKRSYSFKTNFTFLSSSMNDYSNFHEVKDWINSFKNVSVLISESGPLERKLFFIKQHKIIDDFLQIEKKKK